MTFCHNVTVLINMLSGRLEACCLSYGRVATRLNGTKVPTAVLYTSRRETSQASQLYLSNGKKWLYNVCVVKPFCLFIVIKDVLNTFFFGFGNLFFVVPEIVVSVVSGIVCIVYFIMTFIASVIITVTVVTIIHLFHNAHFLKMWWN